LGEIKMENLNLTKEQYEYIEECVEIHRENTFNDVDFGDILFSWFNNDDFSSTSNFHILNDWDEGKDNDPFWDEERDEHSAICFIFDMCVLIKSFHQHNNQSVDK
jgi:hypothetical protein